mgnify:CR=1 FL=1
MVKAYIMVTSSIGEVREVFTRLEDLDSAVDINMVTGPFDIVVLVEAEDLSVLTNAVVEEIREIEGVVDTNTAIVVE